MSSKQSPKRNLSEKNIKSPSREKDNKPCNSLLSRHLKKVYPVSLQKTCSTLSLSSLSLTLSEKSCDSSLSDSPRTLEQKITLALRLIKSNERKENPNSPSKEDLGKNNWIKKNRSDIDHDEQGFKRCNWITKNSDKLYVQFHDECWGVPVYDDQQLFELLALSGMLMDFNWTEILKRKEQLRELFAGFNPATVSKMSENEITDIADNKTLTLSECRVRCIVDNAKCMLKIVKEYGSFSSYVWNYVNYKPVINKFRHPRNVPLRSAKAEAMSKDMQKHGFRFVGPVIVYSFMQAAGLTIDHLVDCYRYRECINLAERPWRHV
ncbi:hypothetical protein Leryth_009976 [Lithospermum erythrorhizon]|uniref:DNA-3-methyladenine glycosylase I n=1 Tax=Lithospermum erythrorhizon TaxID=34254 RepID=A0AAV3P6M5_LITER|nr:hypothetical protein Leryth_009976 [Lithospermum erythrorhizon]